ncbi:glycosyltransferase [Microbacterium sp. MC2]
MTLIVDRVGHLDVVRAAVRYFQEALPALSQFAVEPPQRISSTKRVLLTTAHLDTGGLQAVVIDQANRLTEAGCHVVIAVRRPAKLEVDLPVGVEVVVLDSDMASRLDQWVSICQLYSIDVIIDHHIMYNREWPWLTHAALAIGVPTIGWLHNFALRPVLDRSRRTSFLTTHLRLLLRVVTLSPADVAFWKMRGVRRTVYLPNPPSPLTLAALASRADRAYRGGRLQLVWWGRLDNSTKQPHQLIQAAAALSARGVNYSLRIIGPETKSLRSAELRSYAADYGLEAHVEIVGNRDADELIVELEEAHLYLMTSAIEGAPLALLEAQALALPAVMYDLPWLTAVRDSAGIITTPPDDPEALAAAIADLAIDRQRYARLSAAAREFASMAAEVDFTKLLFQLFDDDLPPDYSPSPSVAEASLLIDWLVRYAERSIGHDRPGVSYETGEIAALRRELRLVQRELRHVTAGPSYRLGRAITWMPRTLRDWFTRALRGWFDRRASADATGRVN